jgi:hypothetical protein
VSDREPGSIEDDGPASPPIPSFASLRAPQRRSALDLLVPPAEDASHPVAAPAACAAPAPAAAPRTAEWGDLLLLGAHLGRCVTRGLRTLLRG